LLGLFPPHSGDNYHCWKITALKKAQEKATNKDTRRVSACCMTHFYYSPEKNVHSQILSGWKALEEP